MITNYPLHDKENNLQCGTQFS